MTDATDAPRATQTNGLGVVDPIRVPSVVRAPLVRVAIAYRSLPVLGKVFVVLAVVDVVMRAFGLFGNSLFISLEAPITIVWLFLGQTLPILLPVLLLARRPDAATAMPLVLRGASVIALVVLLGDPFSGLVYGLPDGSGFVAGVGVAIASTLLRAVGWLAIALGLAAITSGRPSPGLAGLSNLVLAALLAAAITQLGLGLILARPDLGDPVWDAASMLGNAMFSVESTVIAYLAWIVIRGTNDTRRPVAARYLATGAFVGGGAIAAFGAVEGAAAIVQVAFGLPPGSILGEGPWAWLSGWPTVAAVLVAFALGLADNSVRMPASGVGSVGAPAPEPDPVRWPTPGGDVPTYHAVDQPPSQEPAKRPRRRKSKEP